MHMRRLLNFIAVVILLKDCYVYVILFFYTQFECVLLVVIATGDSTDFVFLHFIIGFRPDEVRPEKKLWELLDYRNKRILVAGFSHSGDSAIDRPNIKLAMTWEIVQNHPTDSTIFIIFGSGGRGKHTHTEFLHRHWISARRHLFLAW